MIAQASPVDALGCGHVAVPPPFGAPPEAVLFHLDDEGLLGEPGVRLALATALYRSDAVSLGRGAKIAGVALVEFMQHVSRQGIPVIKGDAKTVREDIRNLAAWRKRRPLSMRAR